jgi:hypothetical protein
MIVGTLNSFLLILTLQLAGGRLDGPGSWGSFKQLVRYPLFFINVSNSSKRHIHGLWYGSRYVRRSTEARTRGTTCHGSFGSSSWHYRHHLLDSHPFRVTRCWPTFECRQWSTNWPRLQDSNRIFRWRVRLTLPHFRNPIFSRSGCVDRCIPLYLRFCQRWRYPRISPLVTRKQKIGCPIMGFDVINNR